MKLADAISNTGVSAIIYGESGIGKTHFAGTLPGKTLIIAAETNGIKTLARSANADNIDIVHLPAQAETAELTLQKYNQFFDCFALKDCPFDNVVLDSATELATMMLIMKTDPYKNGGVPTQHNYGEVQSAMRRYLRILRDMTLKGINVIIIALEAEMIFAQTTEGMTSKSHPALSGKKLSPEAEGLFDIVAHLEKRPDGTRYFRLTGNDVCVAKDRFGRTACPATGEELLNINNKENENVQPSAE